MMELFSGHEMLGRQKDGQMVQLLPPLGAIKILLCYYIVTTHVCNLGSVILYFLLKFYAGSNFQDS
jgi:hypothetical protein